MIEVWLPRTRNAFKVSPDSLQEAFPDVLAEDPQPPKVAKLTENIITLLKELHSTPGIDGVALSLINHPPAPTTLSVEVLATLNPESEESSSAVHTVARAGAKLSEGLDQVMPCGMGFYNSENLTPRSFVTIVRRRIGRSRIEESAGVFLFKRP